MSNFVGMSKTGTLLNRKSICVYDSAIMSYTFPLRMIPMQSGKSTNLLVSGALVGVGGEGGGGRESGCSLSTSPLSYSLLMILKTKALIAVSSGTNLY